MLPTILNIRLVLLLSQILLGISCFQYEVCQDRAINPMGSALLSSVLLIFTPGNAPMLCSLSSQMHFTTLVLPLSLLCILCFFWLALFITESVWYWKEWWRGSLSLFFTQGIHPAWALPSFLPSLPWCSQSQGHAGISGSWLLLYWILLFLPLPSYTLTNFCFLVKAYVKAIAIPCPCDLNVWPLFFPQLKCSHTHTPPIPVLVH